MTNVSIRALRHGGDVVDGVAAGERIVLTRSGRAVAEIRPLRPAVLVRRWARIPVVEAVTLRADIDALLDSSL